MKASLVLAALIGASMLSACGCEYSDAHGNCVSRDDYIKQVARDAAHDALVDMLNWCSSPGARYDQLCKSLHSPPQ